MPFHKGHNYCACTAAMECEIVYIIMFSGGNEELEILKENPKLWLSREERKKRMLKVCENASRYAKVIPAVIDISELKLPDGTEDWDAEMPLVRELLGDRLDAVYSSEESYGEYFARAYPEAVHRLVDVRRINYPISGTKIREMDDEEERMTWII